MRLLLDTHAFLWFIDDSPRLSARAKALLESDADLLLSVASLWEISIKVSIGKLSLAEPYGVFTQRQLTDNAIELADKPGASGYCFDPTVSSPRSVRPTVDCAGNG